MAGRSCGVGGAGLWNLAFTGQSTVKAWAGFLSGGRPSSRHPFSIAFPISGTALSVATAPRRGNPIARRGTWQRMLALGDGGVRSVREHAIHAVAEHCRVQVGIGVGQGLNMHEQPRRAQPLQAIRIRLGSLGADAISARGNRRDIGPGRALRGKLHHRQR